MAQESIYKSVAVIGSGPAGCICAKFLKDAGYEVKLFEKDKFLKTILPTGGGKCNLANAQFDFKELAKNYPRGEKFLYSIFSRFSTQDTIDFFKSIGVSTYIREDNKIFPTSNSAKEVREKLLKSLNNVVFINEEVLNIKPENKFYKIITNKAEYYFDVAVIAIGGHSDIKFLKDLGINIIPQTQSLVGLETKNNFSHLAGVKVCDAQVYLKNKIFKGDLLFTHKGISGPVIYTLSSVFAKNTFPYEIVVKLANIENLQTILNNNPNKTITNALKGFLPKALVLQILKNIKIDTEIICSKINGQMRNLIQSEIEHFKIQIIGKVPTGEVVICGGVDLKEVNNKTLESKKYKNLYFVGEVLDIDGLCGGFNLQNCWSNGYVAATGIINNSI